jgi:hypothetical protein
MKTRTTIESNPDAVASTFYFSYGQEQQGSATRIAEDQTSIRRVNLIAIAKNKKHPPEPPPESERVVYVESDSRDELGNSDDYRTWLSGSRPWW